MRLLALVHCLLLCLLTSGVTTLAFAAADPFRERSAALEALYQQLQRSPERAALTAVPDASVVLDASAVVALIILAEADMRRGRNDVSLQRLTIAEHAARALEQPESLLAVLEALAANHLDQVRFEACDAAISELLALANRRGMPLWQARAHALRGAYWRRKGNYEQALSAHEQALSLREASGDRFGQVQSINAISMLKRRGGELYQALDGHSKALRLARELGDTSAVTEALRLIARVYAELDDDEQAERFYREALSGVEAYQSEARAELLLDLASVMVRSKNLAEAETLTNEAIDIGERRGADYSGFGYFRRADILAARGQLDAALQWVERAIEAGRNVDGVRSVLVKRAGRLRLLLKLERFNEAVQEGNWVLNTAREVGDTLLERDALRHHAEALFGSGDSVRAFAAMARYSDLNEQVVNSMTSRRIADLESSLKRRALEADLALTAKERDVNQLRAERQRWISIGAGLLGLALFFAVLASRARYQKIRATNALLQAQSAKLKQASETDPLTGLCNRRGALIALDALQQSPQPLAVILIDINHFKKINDRFGHAGGDDVLRAVAQRLRDAAASGWTTTRWGGEEFLMFGPEPNQHGAPELHCEHLLQSIRSEPIAAGGTALSVTASLGYACMNSASSNWEALVHRADTALYEAKVNGRNQTRLS